MQTLGIGRPSSGVRNRPEQALRDAVRGLESRIHTAEAAANESGT